MLACLLRNKVCVKVLVENGANVNKKDNVSLSEAVVLYYILATYVHDLCWSVPLQLYSYWYTLAIVIV